MKPTFVTAILALALSACLAPPEDASEGSEGSEATFEVAAELGSPAFFTVSPNSPNSGTRYRGSQRGPTDPGTCNGDIPIQRLFRFNSESRSYVEVTFFACVAGVRGGLRPNGRAFDLYID
jgi:hypothetical protein